MEDCGCKYCLLELLSREITMNLSEKMRNRILKLESEDIAERKEAIAQLSENENELLEKLLVSFLQKNTSQLFKESACTILGEIGTEKSVDTLIQCLDESNEGINFHAAVALGNIGDERAVDALIEKLNKKTDPILKSEAIIALGKIGDKKAVKPIMKVLENEQDRIVKHHAAKTLGQLGDKRAIKTLQKISREGTTRLSYLALNAIQEIEGK